MKILRAVGVVIVMGAIGLFAWITYDVREARQVATVTQLVHFMERELPDESAQMIAQIEYAQKTCAHDVPHVLGLALETYRRKHPEKIRVAENELSAEIKFSEELGVKRHVVDGMMCLAYRVVFDEFHRLLKKKLT
jgi:hypothetical protein